MLSDSIYTYTNPRLKMSSDSIYTYTNPKLKVSSDSIYTYGEASPALLGHVCLWFSTTHLVNIFLWPSLFCNQCYNVTNPQWARLFVHGAHVWLKHKLSLFLLRATFIHWNITSPISKMTTNNQTGNALPYLDACSQRPHVIKGSFSSLWHYWDMVAPLRGGS